VIYPVAQAFIYEDTQFTVYANDSVGAGEPLEVNVSAVIRLLMKYKKLSKN
jgi:hypothetical protein